jgi:hypothetical protein
MDGTGLGSFIWEVRRPSKDGFVACLVVTPRRRDGSGSVDTHAKLERHLGRSSALDLAQRLLKACGATSDLLQQVHKLEG